MSLENKTILLVISGGIAAYKSLELIRLIKHAGANVRCILTKGGSQFVTPLSVAALSGGVCYTDLWSLTDEAEMGHIRLAREADLVVVAPASADFMAKMAHGLASDLASTCLLATDAPVMVVPAMNPYMWGNAATQNNVQTLRDRGIEVLNPESGEMACGEIGQGRMIEPEDILTTIRGHLSVNRPLAGKHAIVTSGPTFEPIDPVRYIGNRSSGKQGRAIACALRDAGANVTYITGPTALSNPHGVDVVSVETAAQMMVEVDKTLPADIFVAAAAVADYGVKPTIQKQKKKPGKMGLDIDWVENTDILKTVSNHGNRPAIVVGFAAETDNMIENARIKFANKGCDMMVANHVGQGGDPIFMSDHTSVTILSNDGESVYKDLPKTEVATILTNKIIECLEQPKKIKQKDIAA